MANENKQILDELKEIKSDVKFIKEHMVDIDTILTPEEEVRLKESVEEFEDGKTTSIEDFEKELA
ncbi:MAG: hypothetical protein AABX59_01000 [Nanoarchaeota archaeon]